jgi:hypothetical protein
MALDIEDYRFIGLANTIAMEEFSASFNDDAQNLTRLSLLEEYKTAGSPADRRSWLRQRLASLFVCHMNPPEWVESMPMWPFLESKAMTFIHQFTVEENDVANVHLVPKSVLYVFGLRVPVEAGWQMEYRVVEQHPDLP